MERCLWITPSSLDPRLPPTSAQKFAESVATHCEMVVVGLQVWSRSPDDPYGLATEVKAVGRTATDLGWHRYHLFGFSAGATVALAAARANPNTVATLALFEPATIGDDDWSAVEQRWRQDLEHIRRLPSEQRQTAFRRLLMAPDQGVPPRLVPPPAWDARSDRLEDLLARVGFDSQDLRQIHQPTLAMSGELSNPRFLRMAERLVEVLPHARSTTFAGCSHLTPPHRASREALESELVRLWRLG